MTPVEQMLLANRRGDTPISKGGCTLTVTEMKHRSFAYEWLNDFNVLRAYRATVATDAAMSDDSCIKAGYKLLKTTFVQQIIDKEECRAIAASQLKKDDVILQLQRVYLKAMSDRDYSSANGALDKLMKHFGMYKEHNKQKKYNADELVSIRRKLEENGVVFDAPNKPFNIEPTGTEEVT